MALGIFSKRIFATNRAASGRIRTIFRRSKAGPRGHILGPFLAPGGPKKEQEKNTNTFFEKNKTHKHKLLPFFGVTRSKTKSGHETGPQGTDFSLDP